MALNDLITRALYYLPGLTSLIRGTDDPESGVGNGKVLRSKASSLTIGNSAEPVYGFLTADLIPKFQVGDRSRTIGEQLNDNGRSLAWHRSSSNPADGVVALNAAFNYRGNVSDGFRHVVWANYGWLWSGSPNAAPLTDGILECPQGISPGAPPMVIGTNNAAALWNLTGAKRFRCTGVYHAKYRAVPTSTTFGMIHIGAGAEDLFFDTIILESANVGLYLENCNRVRINRLIVMDATTAVTATATAQNVSIGEIIGVQTVNITAGATVSIGTGIQRDPTLANKAIYYDSTGQRQTIDWLLDQSMTPVVTAATPGDLSVAYGASYMRYHKRGRQVELFASITFTPTYTTASGDLRINLPFAADTQSALCAFTITTVPNFTWPSSATMIHVTAEASAAYATIRGFRSGASAAAITPITSFASGSTHTIRFRGIYDIA